MQDIATGLEHVGSTSVPELAAKPIIDMGIIVPELEAANGAIERLSTLQYVHLGELGIHERHAFFSAEERKLTPDERTKIVAANQAPSN